MKSGLTGRWPWKGARMNPSPDRFELRPRWLPLRVDGAWNLAIREAVRGKAGVYALREKRSPRVLYVGESHASTIPARMWKTIVRHFQDPSGAFRQVRGWSHQRPGDLEIALWLTAPSEAFALEGVLIARLEPLHATSRPTFGTPASRRVDAAELEAAPF